MRVVGDGLNLLLILSCLLFIVTDVILLYHIRRCYCVVMFVVLCIVLNLHLQPLL